MFPYYILINQRTKNICLWQFLCNCCLYKSTQTTLNWTSLYWNLLHKSCTVCLLLKIHLMNILLYVLKPHSIYGTFYLSNFSQLSLWTISDMIWYFSKCIWESYNKGNHSGVNRDLIILHGHRLTTTLNTLYRVTMKLVDFVSSLKYETPPFARFKIVYETITT